jgi:glycosyltransferase involved in cell wall biosynthesis
MMQDVWPDNAVQSRLIAYDSLIYRYFEYFQKRVYHNSNRIVCISDDMKTFIVSKGVSAEKIQVIYNWGYSDKIVHISWEENRFVQKYCLKKDTFYAVYSGNIGRMQNVEIIVNAAEELQNYSTIRFLIVGDGVSCEKIKNMISDKKLQNVTMLPMQSVELVTDINSAANVNIIPLVSGGVKTAMPSKIGVCLSCCKPILVCFDENSKFSSIVKEYGAGECVGAESSEQLAEAVKRYAVRNINCEDGAATLFKDLFTRSANVQKYIKVVEAK